MQKKKKKSAGEKKNENEQTDLPEKITDSHKSAKIDSPVIDAPDDRHLQFSS